MSHTFFLIVYFIVEKEHQIHFCLQRNNKKKRSLFTGYVYDTEKMTLKHNNLFSILVESNK
jgi:hypothetical protein